jgi:hypothetical protein
VADTVTTHRDFTKIEIGASDNTWGTKLNANFDQIDESLGATITKSTTSGDITLTSDEHASSRIRLTGTLVGNLNVVFDGVRGGCWVIDNDTTAGGYVVTAKVAGQTGVVIPANSSRLVFFNGTDVEAIGTTTTDPQVAALAALTPAADKAMYWTSETEMALVDTTAFGRSAWALADAAAMRTLADAQRQGVIKAPVTKTDNYTFVLTDNGGFLRMDAASVKDFTIPPNSSVAFPVGSWMDLASIGASAARVKGGVGVTLNAISAGTASFAARWRGALLVKVDTDAWEVYGGVGAVA